MKFAKLHGIGNDYLIFDSTKEEWENPAGFARAVCDRHFGVGGDGIILILPSEIADLRMEMYNRDGSRGVMCGNGIRCLAKYACECGLTASDLVRVETDAGVRTVRLHRQGGRVTSATVCMGKAAVLEDGRLTETQRKAGVALVSVGNLHGVRLATADEMVHFSEYAPTLAEAPSIPGGVNLEFVHPMRRDRFLMRVWERGSGETLACGTGAAAAAWFLMEEGLCGESVTAVQRGGELKLTRLPDGEMELTGETALVCEGVLSPEFLAGITDRVVL